MSIYKIKSMPWIKVFRVEGGLCIYDSRFDSPVDEQRWTVLSDAIKARDAYVWEFLSNCGGAD